MNCVVIHLGVFLPSHDAILWKAVWHPYGWLFFRRVCSSHGGWLTGRLVNLKCHLRLTCVLSERYRLMPWCTSNDFILVQHLRLGYTGLSYKTRHVHPNQSQKQIEIAHNDKKSAIERVPLGKSDACGQIVKSTFIEISHNEKVTKKIWKSIHFLKQVDPFWRASNDCYNFISICSKQLRAFPCFFGWVFFRGKPHKTAPGVCFFAK